MTSFQQIIAGCEDTVNVYDAVTFVLQQSLSTPEKVTKIQVSPNGSILFFAHTSSVTMWDVQTGGLIYTFTTQSEINDIAISTTGNYIACGSSDGSIAFWNVHTREGRGFGNGPPIPPKGNPPIPAKIPMNHGPPPPPPEENAWALLEEMKRIDLGTGRARRRGYDARFS